MNCSERERERERESERQQSKTKNNIENLARICSHKMTMMMMASLLNEFTYIFLPNFIYIFKKNSKSD